MCAPSWHLSSVGRGSSWGLTISVVNSDSHEAGVVVWVIHPLKERMHGPRNACVGARARTPLTMLAVAPPGQRPLKSTRPLCSMHALLLATAKTQLLGEHSCTALQWAEIKGQPSTAELVRRPKSATPKLAAFPPAAVDASFTTSCFTASRCGGPRLELADQHHQRRLVLTATTCADTYAPGPPYCTCGLRVPASCVLYVSEAQGSLPGGTPYAYQPRSCRTYRVMWHHRPPRSSPRCFSG